MEYTASVAQVQSQEILTITLTSPHNRNALTPELVEGIREGLAEARRNARVVVIAAEGPAFCAGLDLKEQDPERLRLALELLVGLLRDILDSPVPVIARVHGAARAGGLGILGAADFVVAADEVDFAFTEARLGLAPVVVSATVLRRLASRDAARLFLTGESITADEAARLGLVTHTAPRAELDSVVQAIADSLLRADPQGLRESKAILNVEAITALDRDAAALVAKSLALFRSPEARDAIARARRG
ncbi:enoyl-CoA hydratase-related protein [Amnibacterium flavum]|uniref:Enoyl-CoA hydratase n=1 Tax=Amnibacterium flavum TaxID=2173173 RepID=A0A2V1HWV7_9MICO|nr:enoyl-CoA hydratase-related protein [Amnibacterium flavum]PVZ95729.1 enoyl-CoA hydratase [Amnibacterium flavum]